MSDPLDYWCGNTEVLETLTSFLSLSDLGRCCQLSSRWRAALNQDHIWWRLAGRLEGCREMYDTVSSLRLEAGDLAPLCGWARTVSVWRGVRRRWRRGGEVITSPQLPASQPDTITCYDCEGDLMVLGTERANIFSYNLELGLGWRVVRAAVTRRRVDKVYTRHGLVIALQGGLIQVFTASLHLLYCKSLELQPSQNHQDEFFMPEASLEEVRTTYSPSRGLNISQLDMTVSTTGRPQLWLARGGDKKASCYCLLSGEHQDTLHLEPGDTIFKLGLVQEEKYSSYLYILVHDDEHRTVGTMYHTELNSFLWRLQLTNVFSYQHNVFSVYTPRGLLMFGRLQGDTDYPFTWTWRGLSYDDGGEFYRASFQTEFDMSLTDWSSEAVITPRAMSFLFTCSRYLAFTQRSHRGTSTFAYRWVEGGQGTVDGKIWKSSCAGDLRSDCPVKLVGSEVGEVVVTSHGSTLQVRDLNTGIKMREINLNTRVDVMWADEWKIVTLNKNIDSDCNINILKMT